MADDYNFKTEGQFYQIKISGHLGQEWIDWFEGLDITLEINGETILSGPLVDQAALFGVLKKIRDLGIPLISVICTKQSLIVTNDRQEKIMKAITFSKYGAPEVLQLKEVEKPTPKDNQVLIKIMAASINAAEQHIIKGDPFPIRFMLGGIFTPKKNIPGADLAGRVEQVGKDVKKFKVGDEVYGDLSGYGWGTFAEYVAVAEDALTLKPNGTTFEAAASVPLAAVTALQGLRDHGHIKAGQKVLVVGASGGVGSFAVQLAKAFGAEVTAVASTKKLGLIQKLGADHIIDRNKEDFTKNGQSYDLILDAGAFRSLSDYKRILKPNGIYVLVGGSNGQLFKALLFGPLISMFGNKKMGSMLAKPNPQDLACLTEFIEAGKVVPALDKSFALSQTVEAMNYFNSGQVQGKIVIKI